MVYRNDRFLRGGDHSPYVENGFAAVRITEMNENYNHQHQDVRTEKGVVYGDLAEFMDFEYLRKNTAMNLANLANLAKSPGMPQEVKVEVRNLTNGTQLSWKAPAYGRPKGYYILMRETTSAVWEKKIFVSGLAADLPYSRTTTFLRCKVCRMGGMRVCRWCRCRGGRRAADLGLWLTWGKPGGMGVTFMRNITS